MGRLPWGSSSWVLPIPCSACSRSGDPTCWVCHLLELVAESAHMQNQDPRLWGRGRPVPALAMPPALPGARDGAGVHRLRGRTCIRGPKEPCGVLSPGAPLCPRDEVHRCLAYDVLPSSSSPLFSSVQSLNRVRLFGTPWTAARQASLSITNSWRSPKPMSIEAVMPSSHLILCRPLLLPSIFPSIRVFSNESAPLLTCIKFCMTNAVSLRSKD